MKQSTKVDGSGNVVVQIEGDGNTVIAHLPHLELTRHFQRRRVREIDGEPSVADLVSAYTMSIPPRGRDDVMTDFRAWLESDQPISVRVLVGSAGRGKTRLALELCAAAAERDWRAGFLTSREMERFRGQQNVAAWGWNAPVLMVVDYAASHAEPLHEWLVELADNPARSGLDGGEAPPLRLLLLERQADVNGGWWRTVFGRGSGDARAAQGLLEDQPAPITLPAIEDAEDRRAIIGDMLERAGSGLRPPARAEDPGFDRQLAELSWGGDATPGPAKISGTPSSSWWGRAPCPSEPCS